MGRTDGWVWTDEQGRRQLEERTPWKMAGWTDGSNRWVGKSGKEMTRDVHHPFTHHPFKHHPLIPQRKGYFGLCSTENQKMHSSICNLLKTATVKKWQRDILNSSCSEVPWSQMSKRHPGVSKYIDHSLPSQMSLLIYTPGTCAQNLLLLYYIKHCNLLQETFDA